MPDEVVVESPFEKRVAALEAHLKEATKKAALVALVAAVLGGGGVTGLFQFLAGAKLRDADAALRSAEARLRTAEALSKELEAAHKKKEQDLADGKAELDAQINTVKLKTAGLEQYEKEFTVRQKHHEAVIAQLEKGILAAKGAGDSRSLAPLVDELIQQNQAFANFASQTQNAVAGLPGAPGWYQGAALQAQQSVQQGQARLQALRAALDQPR